MKRKILVLSPCYPYPPDNGLKIRVYNITKILSKHYKCDLISLTLNKKNSSLNHVYPINSIKKFLLSPLYLLDNSLPLQAHLFFDKSIYNTIQSRVNDYDLFFSFTIRTSTYLSAIKKPKILDFIDSLYLSYSRSKIRTKSLLWKTIYHLEHKKLKKIEEDCLRKFDAVLFINKKEKEFYPEFHNTFWIPNGVNDHLFDFDIKPDINKNNICFLGNMNYQPNLDAMLWFIENVFPLLHKSIKLYIIGNISNVKKIFLTRKSKHNKRIIFTGFLDNPYNLISDSLLVIAPIISGGGLQNKVIEAMASGKIVVSTSSVAQAVYSAQNYEHLICTDSPQQMAETINKIHFDYKKYYPICHRARELIKRFYTWSAVETKLLSILEQ